MAVRHPTGATSRPPQAVRGVGARLALISLDRLDSVFRSYAGFLPGLAVAGAVSLLLFGTVGRRLGVRPLLALALLMSLGVILAATLFPSPEVVGQLFGAAAGQEPAGSGTCNLTSFGLIPIGELVEVGERTANVLLLAPLGACIWLLPRRLRLPAVAAGLALPFAIEATQFALPVLGRACEGRDLADNLTGLIVGLAVGFILRGAWPALAARRS